MKLLVDKDWLRRQIENDPEAEMDSGHVIRCSTDVVKAVDATRRPEIQKPAVETDAPTGSPGTSNVVRFPLGQPSPVRLGRGEGDRLAAYSGSITHDLAVERTGTYTLVDEGRSLVGLIEMRTVGRLGSRIQASWISGAIVELRVDERNPEPRPLPLDGTWLDLDLGSRTIDDGFVSRAFELQPREAGERSRDESDD